MGLAEGKGLLVLLPSEREAMVKLLAEAKVPIQATKVNPTKTGQSLTPALQALLSKSPELKVRLKLLTLTVKSCKSISCHAAFASCVMLQCSREACWASDLSSAYPRL